MSSITWYTYDLCPSSHKCLNDPGNGNPRVLFHLTQQESLVLPDTFSGTDTSITGKWSWSDLAPVC